MDMADKWIELTKSVVHPWLCDSQQHMNTRHYAALFDDAGWLLLSILGYRRAMANEGIGWADVRHVTEFKQEAPLGCFLRVDGTVANVGRSSLTIQHRLANLETGEVLASFEGVTVCYDLAARKSRPLPDEVREAAQRILGGA
jgi:acyl-CoA thioester hydrolase